MKCSQQHLKKQRLKESVKRERHKKITLEEYQEQEEGMREQRRDKKASEVIMTAESPVGESQSNGELRRQFRNFKTR